MAGDLGPRSSILHYRSTLAYNREVFLLKHPFAIADFERTDDNFDVLMRPLYSGRDRHGHSQIALLPFLALGQRQCRSAFEAVSSFRSYEAWLLVRPAIEAILIAGKWLDDPRHARTWVDRKSDPKRYRKIYQGAALRSQSLVISEQLQSVLSKINDDYVHSNFDYYNRHLRISEIDDQHVGMSITYTDDEHDAEASLYALFSLTLTMQAGWQDMLSKLFDGLEDFNVGLPSFLREYLTRVQALVAAHPTTAAVLQDFGLWRLDA